MQKGHGKIIPRQGLVIWLILGLVLSGCVDLSAIRKFSNLSTNGENYTRLTEDFVNIPEREKYYAKPKYLSKLEARRKEREEKLKPGILELHKAVAEYMKALGELADDELISYKKSLGNLKEEVKNSSLVKNGPVTKETVDAYAALADLLSKAVNDGYRRKKLQEVIGKANSPLKIILSDQQKIIEIYKDDLNDELRNYVNDYYGKVISDLDVFSIEENNQIYQSKDPMKEYVFYLGNVIWNDKNVPVEKRAALVPLRKELQTKLTEYDHNKKAADNYLALLDNIKKGHQQLYDMRYQFKSEALMSIINSYSAEIQKLYQALIAMK